jgi:predicted component of type VI protein secretion system
MKITKDRFLIGRSEECQLRPNSEKISRHHCVILLGEGSASIRDLGSKNGTLVNGERVVGEQELKAGDVLEVGPLKFEVRPTVDIKREKKPMVKSVAEAAARTAESQDSDMDVSDWLMDGLAPKTKPNEDTVDISRTEMAGKSFVPPPPPAPPAAAAPAADSGSKAGLDSGSKSGQKAEPGKLPPQPKTTSANSMSAAAEALKKLSQRR